MNKKYLLIAVAVLFLFQLGTVGVLLGVKAKAEKRLSNASGFLRELGEQHIDHLVQVRDSIDVETEITITEPVPVDIDMLIREKIPIKMMVQIDENIEVPVDLKIDELVSVDTSIVLPDTVTVKADSEIPVDQKFVWMWTKKGGPKMRIKADIPLNQELNIAFTDALRFKSTIPVRFNLKDKMLVPLNMSVPVDQNIDLALHVDQKAIVGFPYNLKMKARIPIVLDIQVRIPLRDTPIKKYLDKTADELDGMLSF